MNSGNSYTQSSNAIGSSANPYDPYKENDPVKPMNYNSEYWKDLDPDYIESRWVARGEQVSEYFLHYLCCVMPSMYCNKLIINLILCFLLLGAEASHDECCGELICYIITSSIN